MTKAQQYIIISIIVLSGLVFWLSQQKPELELPNAIGDPLELVVVKDLSEFKSDFYQTLANFLNTDIGPSPQTEMMLNIIEIDNKKFTGILQRHHNILIISKSQNFSIQIKKDVFAKDQTVILLTCRSIQDLDLHKAKIRQLNDSIKSIEIDRLISGIKKKNNKKLSNKILQNHQISILVPNGFFLAHDDTNLTWIRRETPKLSQGIFIANISKELQEQFFKEPSNVIDSLLKDHISGPLSGSYMITERKAPVKKDSILVNGLPMIKHQSLWRIKNDFMGGIYMCYVLSEAISREPVFIYTYLYSPGEEKKTSLIQLEAIVHTMSLFKNRSQ